MKRFALWLRFGIFASIIPILAGMLLFPLTVSSSVEWTSTAGILLGHVIPFHGYRYSATMLSCEWQSAACIVEGLPGYIAGYLVLIVLYFCLGCVVGVLFERLRTRLAKMSSNYP